MWIYKEIEKKMCDSNIYPQFYLRIFITKVMARQSFADTTSFGEIMYLLSPACHSHRASTTAFYSSNVFTYKERKKYCACALRLSLLLAHARIFPCLIHHTCHLSINTISTRRKRAQRLDTQHTTLWMYANKSRMCAWVLASKVTSKLCDRKSSNFMCIFEWQTKKKQDVFYYSIKCVGDSCIAILSNIQSEIIWCEMLAMEWTNIGIYLLVDAR